MDENKNIVLYNSQAKYARLSVICLIFVGCGITTVHSDTTTNLQLIGWSSIIFFGIGIIVAIRQLLNRKPRILIDSNGITDNTLKVGLIEWRDIKGATLTRIEREHFIQLELASESKYLDRLSIGHKRAADANKLLGYQRFNINLSGVKCDAREILNIVRQESGYARNSGH